MFDNFHRISSPTAGIVVQYNNLSKACASDLFLEYPFLTTWFLPQKARFLEYVLLHYVYILLHGFKHHVFPQKSKYGDNKEKKRIFCCSNCFYVNKFDDVTSWCDHTSKCRKFKLVLRYEVKAVDSRNASASIVKVC